MLLNFFKKYNWLIKEYLQSPFICWGISFLILAQLEETVQPVREFRRLLWTHGLDWVFFIPILFMAMAMSITPFSGGIRQMLKERKSMGYATFFVITLILIFLAEGIYYKIEIITIIGQQHEETIIDEERFKNIKHYVELAIFFFMPGVAILIQHNLKKQFIKRHLKLTLIKWDRLISVNWMMFILLLIGFWIINIHILHTLSC